MRKDLKTSITLSEIILNWIDEKINERKFASRSHAIEYCVLQEMKKDSNYMTKVGSKIYQHGKDVAKE